MIPSAFSQLDDDEFELSEQPALQDKTTRDRVFDDMDALLIKTRILDAGEAAQQITDNVLKELRGELVFIEDTNWLFELDDRLPCADV